VLGIITGGILNQADSAVGNLPAIAGQELVFWFTLWGFLMVLVGELLVLFERSGLTVPAWVGYQLLLLNLVCAVMLPKGGFWWVLLPAYRIIRQQSNLRSRINPFARPLRP
jgi:hypothetical protein